MRRPPRPPSARRARGAALLIGLLLLAALAGLGAVAGTGAVLQARMADNFHHRANARGAAAVAERAAEGWLFGMAETAAPAPCAAPCGAGGVIRSPSTLPRAIEEADAGWWRQAAFAAGTDPVSGEVLAPWRPAGAEPARWLITEAAIENVATNEGEVPVAYYRVFARGSHAGDRGAVVLEALLARPWGPAPSDADGGPMTPRRFCRSMPAELPCGRLAWRELR